MSMVEQIIGRKVAGVLTYASKINLDVLPFKQFYFCAQESRQSRLDGATGAKVWWEADRVLTKE